MHVRTRANFHMQFQPRHGVWMRVLIALCPQAQSNQLNNIHMQPLLQAEVQITPDVQRPGRSGFFEVFQLLLLAVIRQ